MTTRNFHYQDGASAKFWQISRAGATCTVQFGKLGSAGQTQTKTYPDETAAQAAYDKQIAEKLRKGYHEQHADEQPVTAPAPAPPVAQASPEPLAPPTPFTASPAATNSAPRLELEPTDWLWAPWRAAPALPRPAAAPFDRAAAQRRLAKLPVTNYGWSWRWDTVGLAPTLSREAAHFWFAAMTRAQRGVAPAVLATQLADEPLDGNIGVPSLIAGLGAGQYVQSEVVLTLAGLLSTEELIGLLADIAPGNARDWNSRRVPPLLDGFRAHVLPYLAPDERQHWGRMLAPRLDPALWPSDLYETAPLGFYLAAMLGGAGAALGATVAQWADDRFGDSSWSDHYQRPQEIVLGLDEPRLVEQHMRRLGLRLNKPEYVRGWLAQTEFAALDVVRDSALAQGNKDEAAQLVRAFACAIGPEVAPHMLELMLASKAPQPAREWLEAHTEHAVAGVVPLAAGRGKLAEGAAELLRRYARRGQGELIAAQLASLPAENAARLRASVLDAARNAHPPLDETTTPRWLQEALGAQPYLKLAKPVSWLRAADLAPIVVGAHQLNSDQGEALLRALQRSTLDAPHPLVAAVRTHADGASRDAFAWGVFEQWLADGAPAKEKWALAALGLLGGDPSALKLAPLVRAWPGESQHQRAVLGLEALRAIGSDSALMQINGIAQKVKFKALQERAGACMEQIAQNRGLSRAQLEDRIVPDCELDERGERVFEFGPRRFRFLLGPDLKPMLRDEQGALKPDLPKPNAKDDQAVAQASIAAWKLLKKQVFEVAKIQAVRLEQAMVTGRRWSPAEFLQLVVRHPLMTHLARTLVWGAYDQSGALAATFRVTEDQSLADSADELFELSGDTTIGIVHPLQLGEAAAASWGELLSDYEIVPPFAQLGRTVRRLEPDEHAAKELVRFNDLKIPAAALVFGLDKLGWVRDAPADAGGFSGHSKPFHQASVTAVIQYEEGVGVGYIVEAPSQQIEYVAFVPGIRAPEWWPRHDDRLPLGQIDPVVISEVLSDLAVLVAKAE